ncbi:hypothetical protein BVG19_g5310 [[Candida] boidinii]|nr:hypothetical protein BVG19_g5310 [[Candida] boidinii]OWB53124.1 hypothetical protein B5S27_g4716 [[Candida] boidinii]OWB84116.1 hypothetical protein B5S33_g2756 [[Candida] boidinii]
MKKFTVEEIRRIKFNKRGLQLSILVCGETGTGKSTFINTLCDDNIIPLKEEYPEKLEIENYEANVIEGGTQISLNISVTEGFGSNIDNSDNIRTVTDYIDNKFEEVLIEEFRVNRNPDYKDGRIHIAIYFIRPNGKGLKELDIKCLRALGERCNVVPIIAKADLLMDDELQLNKTLIMKDIYDNKIKIFDFSTFLEEFTLNNNNEMAKDVFTKNFEMQKLNKGQFNTNLFSTENTVAKKIYDNYKKKSIYRDKLNAAKKLNNKNKNKNRKLKNKKNQMSNQRWGEYLEGVRHKTSNLSLNNNINNAGAGNNETDKINAFGGYSNKEKDGETKDYYNLNYPVGVRFRTKPLNDYEYVSEEEYGDGEYEGDSHRYEIDDNGNLIYDDDYEEDDKDGNSEDDDTEEEEEDDDDDGDYHDDFEVGDGDRFQDALDIDDSLRIAIVPFKDPGTGASYVSSSSVEDLLPFSTICSNETEVIDGKVCRVRKLSFGTININDTSSSDFTILRTCLFGGCLQELKDTTHKIFYEKYRTKRLSFNEDNASRDDDKLPMGNIYDNENSFRYGTDNNQQSIKDTKKDKFGHEIETLLRQRFKNLDFDSIKNTDKSYKYVVPNMNQAHVTGYEGNYRVGGETVDEIDNHYGGIPPAPTSAGSAHIAAF